MVETAEEQEAWRDYLRGQGVECSEVFDRGAFRSLYVRDPDAHIVEIATAGPGSGPAVPTSSEARSGSCVSRLRLPMARRRSRTRPRGRSFEARRERARWRSVMEPHGLGLGHRDRARKRRQRVRPHRCWLISRSAIAMLSPPRALEHDVRHGRSPRRPPARLSSARARRTRFACAQRAHVLRRRGRRCCVHGTSPLSPPRGTEVVLAFSRPHPGPPGTSATNSRMSRALIRVPRGARSITLPRDASASPTGCAG
jgi:hypothetical protein